MSQEYLDCELYLTNYEQAKLTVDGRDYSGRPQLDEKLQQELRRVVLDDERYGALLFHALFPAGDNLLNGYRVARELARSNLRFRLHIAATAPMELHSLHWELLYDTEEKLAFARGQQIVFSRYTSVPLKANEALAAQPKLLIVISNPKNLGEYQLAEIDVEAAKQEIKRALHNGERRIDYEFLEGPATLVRIRGRMNQSGFHALHIQAHGHIPGGLGMASLVLETEDGNADFVNEQHFSEVFADDRNLRLVTLIACHSGTQTRDDPFSGLALSLVRRGIPAVIAMQQALRFETATRFIEHFYPNLAQHGQVDSAINEARLRLYSAERGNADWSAPVLYMRLEEGRIFDIRKISDQTIIKPSPDSSEVDWESLVLRLNNGVVIPILGPRMTQGLLPSAEEIAESWAREYQYPMKMQDDLPRVAQFIETEKGQQTPHDLLVGKVFRNALLAQVENQDQGPLRQLSLSQVMEKIMAHRFHHDRNEPHRILAELPISTYMTTNYDSFMAAALQLAGKKSIGEYCHWNSNDLNDIKASADYQSLEGTLANPLVFHLYGHHERATSLVLTEDNYLDFLRIIASDYKFRMPERLHSSVVNSMVLFLGYELDSLHFRVLYRTMVAELKDLKRDRIAVLQIEREENQPSRVEVLLRFMKKYCHNLQIKVYEGSVRDFLFELRNHWEKGS